MENKQFKLITIEEFKSMEFYDMTMDGSTTHKDNYINECIYIASLTADLFTGYSLSKKIEKEPNWDYTSIKYGVGRQVQFLLRKGPEYVRGQSSFSLGGQTMASTNPEDPFFVVPELVIELQKQGFLNKQVIDTLSKNKNMPNGMWQGDNRQRPITWLEIIAKFVQYERVSSPDSTILFGSPTDKSIRSDLFNPELKMRVDVDRVSDIVKLKVIDKSFLKIVTDLILKSEELAIGLPNAIANEFLDNENLNELISEILAQFISSTPELTEIYIRGLEKALLKNQEWQNELVVKLLENEKLISELKALTSKIAKEEVENALSDFKPNIEKVVVDPSKELGSLLNQDTSTIKDISYELIETIKAITPGIVRTQIGQPDMNPELGEEIDEFETKEGLTHPSLETQTLTANNNQLAIVNGKTRYDKDGFKNMYTFRAKGIVAPSIFISIPTFLESRTGSKVKASTSPISLSSEIGSVEFNTIDSFVLYPSNLSGPKGTYDGNFEFFMTRKEFKEKFNKEPLNPSNQKVWRFKGGTKDNGIGNIVRNRKIGDYKFEENETDKYNTMVAEGNRIKVLPNSQALLEIQNGASFFELINPQLIVQNPKLAELEGDYYDLDFNKCYVSNEGNFVFRLNVGLDQTELEKSRRALEKVEVYGTCLKYVAPVEPEPEPEEDNNGGDN